MQIQNAGNDQDRALQETREFCASTCVTRVFPACSSLDPTIAQRVDEIMLGIMLAGLSHYCNNYMHTRVFEKQ